MKNNFLEIKGVDFTIGGKVKVKNASFVIENEGDTLCILGPSGIGKTTILRTIAGLEDIVVPGRGSGRGHHDENGDHLPGAHEERKMERKLEKEERKLAQEAGVDMSKYILKSEIVPPVCPKCPDSRTCPREKPAPPCPPCARCPEPAFECKKVPNYSAIDAANAGNLLPMPRLNSFAQFN